MALHAPRPLHVMVSPSTLAGRFEAKGSITLILFSFLKNRSQRGPTVVMLNLLWYHGTHNSAHIINALLQYFSMEENTKYFLNLP